jgi:DNA repair protein RadC
MVVRLSHGTYAASPSERLLSDGVEALSIPELLTVLLGGRGSSVTGDSRGLGEDIMSALSTHGQDPFDKLRNISLAELQQIPGVGPVKAAQLVAAIQLGKRILQAPVRTGQLIDDPALAADALSPELMWAPREKFALLVLDIKHRLLATAVISTGTATETTAHPREIFSEVYKLGGQRCILAHNHPSGSLEPSPEDINLTKQLLNAQEYVGITILDHIILGQGGYISMRQTTSLWSGQA